MIEVQVKDIKELKEESGIYHFYSKEGELLYIGQSVNIRRRMYQHFNSLGHLEDEQLKEVSRVKVRYLLDAPNRRKDKELLEIYLYMPKWNVESRDYKRAIGKRRDKYIRAMEKVNRSRVRDLMKLISLRGKADDEMAYILSYHVGSLGGDFFSLCKYLGEYISKEEVIAGYVRGMTLFVSQRGGSSKWVYIKPYKTENIVELLGITEKEQQSLRYLVGKERKLELERERKRVQRREQGVRSQEDISAEAKQVRYKQWLRIQELQKEGMKVKDILKTVGISKPHYYKILKENGNKEGNKV